MTFHGSFAPVSTSTFPQNLLLTLEADGNSIPGAATEHIFYGSNEMATLSLIAPVVVTSTPTVLQVVASGGTFLYSSTMMTIYKID